MCSFDIDNIYIYIYIYIYIPKTEVINITENDRK
jgi:hypothetical protein